MEQWMRKNVNLHDVAQQINEDGIDICERKQANFIKSKAHLQYLIDAIDGNVVKKCSKIDYRNINTSSDKNINNNYVNGTITVNNHISTRNITKDNLNTEVVKRGPGRPKGDPKIKQTIDVKNGKNSQGKESKGKNGEIKNESNGIIKEEVVDNQNIKGEKPNNFVINKQFMETDNELINN